MAVEDVLIRRPYWTVYFLVYVVIVAVLLGLLWGDLSGEAPLDRVVFASAIFAVSAGSSAGAAVIAELVGGLVMLVIPATFKWIKDRGRKEANAEWEAWLARYREAEASGREFTEPPPSNRNGLET